MSDITTKVYEAISDSLVEFGYKSCTPQLIKETHESMLNGATEWQDMPHGVISAFAQSQLEDAMRKGLIARSKLKGETYEEDKP